MTVYMFNGYCFVMPSVSGQRQLPGAGYMDDGAGGGGGGSAIAVISHYYRMMSQ